MRENVKGGLLVIKRWITAALSCLLCLLLPFGNPAAAEGAAPQTSAPRVLRVAFPLQKGLSERDEDGNPFGYSYEYLQEIAQYTGWEYEFVTLEGDINQSLTGMLDMLARGELDLMGGMALGSGAEELYDYASYSYGNAYSVLLVSEENPVLNESNLQDQQVLRVAVLRQAEKKKDALQKYADASGIKLEMVPCDTQEEQIEALHNGRADALQEMDLNPVDNTRVVARFNPTPYYLATTKGNAEVLNLLNSTIAKINEADPYFSIDLYERFFNKPTESLYLTEDERAFIEQIGTLKVAVLRDKAPIQYLDGETGEFRGVSRGVLERIGQKTGLSFEYVTASSQEELEQLAASGAVHLLAAIPYDYDLARQYHVSLSRSFLTAQMVMAVNRNADADHLEGKRLALPQGLAVPDGADESKVTNYSSVLQCIEAVNRGDADYCIGNAYSIEYYTRSPGYRNIVLVPQTSMVQKVSLGVVKADDDGHLLTIINKVLRSLSDSEIQTIISRHTLGNDSKITLASFIDANPRLVLAVVGVVALLAVALLLFLLRLRMRANRRIALDNRRYSLLADISNEFMYEYDYARDRVTLSENCARAFGCPAVIDHYQSTLDREGPDGELYRHMKRLDLDGGESRTTGEYLLPLADGTSRWYRIVHAPLRDKDGRPAYAIGKLVDIQQEIEEKDALLEKSREDGLTGIYNAAASRELIAGRVEGPADENIPARSSALLIIDIDHFKEVNDRLGHYAGDQVLRGLADILQQLFRRSDIIGRLGGDEFIVYMEDAGDEEAIRLKCDRLCQTVRASALDDSGQSLSVSVGAARVVAGESFDELYRRADRALYRVKERGRDGYLLLEEPDK